MFSLEIYRSAQSEEASVLDSIKMMSFSEFCKGYDEQCLLCVTCVQ